MSYEPTIWRTGDTVTAEKLNKIEQAIVADNTAIEGKVGRDEFDTEIATLESKVGSPLIASTVSEMTETDRVYVYTGSETGYTSGNWYYYDGTAWTSGGVYNAVAIETDTTLSVSGKAADAKKVGDELSSLKEDLNIVEKSIYESVATVAENLITTGQGLSYINGGLVTASDRTRTSRFANNAKGTRIVIGNTPTRILGYSAGSAEPGETTDALYKRLYNGNYTDWVSNTTIMLGGDDYPTYAIVAQCATKSDFIANITRYVPTDIPQIDPTLSIAGAAADARKTGDDLKNINAVSLSNKVNWSDYAALSNSYGWVTGYTGTASGEVISSAYYMTMFYPLSLIGVTKVKITPPTGYACSAVFYTPSGQVYGVGNANSIDHPELIDVPIEQVTVGYSGLRITVGKDNNGMSAKITDPTFIDSVVVEYASGDDDVGYYWDERYQFDKKIKRYLTEPSMVFPLITDIHFMSLVNNPYLFNHSVANIKATVKKYNPDFILNLGDNTDGDKTQLKTVNRNLLMLQKFSELGVPYYHAVGNHDTNYTGGYLLTMPETFLSYCSPVKGVHFNPDTGGTEFYKDFDQYGVRLVVLNANYTKQYRLSSATPAWVRDYALDTNNVVLLAMHLSSISTQNWNGQAIDYGASLTNVITNFVNNGGTVIQLCGHSHADYQFAAPWLTIFSDCAKAVKANIESESYGQITGYVGSISAPDRPFGTSKEDSWSLVVYKPISKTMHLCRFGAGVDRTFHVEPITTDQTLTSVLTEVTWSSTDSNIVTVTNGVVTIVGTGTAAIFATDADGNFELWTVKS